MILQLCMLVVAIQISTLSCLDSHLFCHSARPLAVRQLVSISHEKGLELLTIETTDHSGVTFCQAFLRATYSIVLGVNQNRQRLFQLCDIISDMSDPFPEIKSKHSLVAKHVTQSVWEKLSSVVTATSGFTLAKAIACAVQFDNQHCGIYAGDWDSYKVNTHILELHDTTQV